jgi:RNA polymerase sigma factor (sigma-70 family)
VVRHIRKLAGADPAAQPSDAELLHRFVAAREEQAFATLLHRHGPLVWSVCWQVLHHRQDAEDAFQATALLLARHAGSIRQTEAVASWLHRVAYRVATKAGQAMARRRMQERQVEHRHVRPPEAEAGWRELQAVLNEELERLPEKYRAPFILCCLEGQSGLEAAQQLGWKPGTVTGRLTEARKLLQRRLSRRGVLLSAVLLAAAVSREGAAASASGLTDGTVPTALAFATQATPTSAISPRVAALVRAMAPRVFVTKLKAATALLLAIGVLAGAGVQAHQLLASKDADPAQAPVSQPTEVKEVKAKPPTAAGQTKPSDTFVYRGRVLDPEGNPLTGAKLHLAVPEEITKKRPAWATTGTDGRFEFTVSRAELKLPAEVPADLDVFAYLQVVATASGYGPDWTMFQDGQRPRGDLTLRLVKNDVIIKGRILDLQGKAVARAKIHVLRLETTQQDALTPFLEAWKSQRTGYLPETLLTKTLLDPTLTGLPKTVLTDTDGRFQLPGAGTERILMLSVEAPWIERATFRVLPRSAAEVKILAAAAAEERRGMMRGGLSYTVYGLTFDHLASPARTIVGTVRDKETGKPMAGVRISGHGSQGPVTPSTRVVRATPHCEAYTDKQGHYELQGLGLADKYQLLAWPGEFTTYLAEGKEISGTTDLATLTADFTIMHGVEVRGRVTDKVTGKPVEVGVSYEPGPGNHHPGAAFFRMVHKGCTGPLPGTFREVVPPGIGVFLVSVRAANDENHYTQARLDPADKAKAGLDEIFTLSGRNAYRVIDVPADAKSMTCDIQLDPGRTLNGTVLGPDNKPLSGVMVNGLTAVWPKPTTLKDNKFTVFALDPRQPRELLFVHRKRELAGRLVVRGDEKEAVTVRLEPWGSLTGRILDAEGQPMAGVEIYLAFHHSTFYLPALWWAPPRGELVQTDRDGRFVARGLTPGKKVRLSAASKMKFFSLDGAATNLNELSVGAGETKDLGDLKAKAE